MRSSLHLKGVLLSKALLGFSNGSEAQGDGLCRTFGDPAFRRKASLLMVSGEAQRPSQEPNFGSGMFIDGSKDLST